MDFFDAHAHCIKAQRGGFLIGLEGDPRFEVAVNNQAARAAEDRGRLLFAVEYVSKAAPSTSWKVLKYHPRREGYSPEFVKGSIRTSAPRVCIVDTLNQPSWQPRDYWEIARSSPLIQFVFCHAGGYDILDFLKMADFTANIWLDFSCTQEFFGWTGSGAVLRHVTDGIDFALSSKRLRRKILFGSDEPFYSQEAALRRYEGRDGSRLFLAENFQALVDKARLLERGDR
jgi:hypothetical protein